LTVTANVYRNGRETSVSHYLEVRICARRIAKYIERKIPEQLVMPLVEETHVLVEMNLLAGVERCERSTVEEHFDARVIHKGFEATDAALVAIFDKRVRHQHGELPVRV